METLQIEILNPKVKNLLTDLAELKLIDIKTSGVSSKKNFMEFLQLMRVKSKFAPNQKEILKEVENIRQKRYAKR